jgi:hypothetical protein
MKRVEPAPTIRPMIYATRVLVIWLVFLWFGLGKEIGRTDSL